MRRWAVPIGLVVLAATLTGCGSNHGETTLTVFAASSLTQPFRTLARRFEKQHPGTRVVFSFGPSSGLAQQVQQGAPADVFASASPTNMRQVVRSGDVDDPTTFTRNTLEIAVPPTNPAHVHGLADLARQGVKVAVCQAEVPCGVVAAQVLHNAGVAVKPATEEIDVKSVLAKVSLDEVDAGLVYVTDVAAAGNKVHGVPIPKSVNATTRYPIATVNGSDHPRLARDFERLVLSGQGRAVLAADGFGKP